MLTALYSCLLELVFFCSSFFEVYFFASFLEYINVYKDLRHVVVRSASFPFVCTNKIIKSGLGFTLDFEYAMSSFPTDHIQCLLKTKILYLLIKNKSPFYMQTFVKFLSSSSRVQCLIFIKCQVLSSFE